MTDQYSVRWGPNFTLSEKQSIINYFTDRFIDGIPSIHVTMN